MNIGEPLESILGSNIVLASTGASICGNVLGACGFDVSRESGIGQAAPSSGIAALVTSPKPTMG